MLEGEASGNYHRLPNLQFPLSTVGITPGCLAYYVFVREHGAGEFRLRTLEIRHSVRGKYSTIFLTDTGNPMNTQKLMNTALNGLDAIGYRLDQYGITGRINRHNLAAFLMVEQKHLEGEWDSIQAKIDRRRSQVDGILTYVETRTDAVLRPVIDRVNRFRGVSGH